jgi:hypothetical protein
MNALRKAVLVLGAVAVLLGGPLTAAIDTDDIQTPPAIKLAAASAATSQSARGTVQGRVMLPGAVVLAPCPVVSLLHVTDQVSNFVIHACRFNLRSLCLLRC